MTEIAKSFDLTGRVALVTGASAGLGRHFARTLAAAGADVAAAARRVEACRVLASELEALNRRTTALHLDVTDAASVREAVRSVAETLGPVDILVNNAGVVITKPMLEVEEADWDRVVDTNLKGAWLMAQASARQMVETGRGGCIVNIASLLALRVAKQIPAYAAAKSGLAHLTRAMALELAPHRIRVNAIAPGYIETDMNRELLRSDAGQKLLGRIPQRRFGQPEDLDGVLLLLASDASAYMTGSLIAVDGGHAVSSI